MSRLDRRGVALVMALAASVLVASLVLLGLHGAIIRVRLVADARWRAEGAMVVASALAATRVARRADLDTLADGGAISFVPTVRSDGWIWSVTATRSGALIRLIALARYRASDGTTYASHRASLMLARDPADTVRVLGERARF